MINKRSLMELGLCALISQVHFISADADSISLRGVLALGGLAVTGGVTKMLSNNKFIDKYADNTGVTSGEIATVTGLMGGLFSLGNAIPEANTYGWLVPVLYGSYKVANSNWLNHYFFANIPNVGEHIASREILDARRILKSSGSPFYNMRLLCVLNMIKKHGLDNMRADAPKAQYDLFNKDTQGMMTKEEWEKFFETDAGLKLVQKYEMFYRKDKPFEIKPDMLGKAFFATTAITLAIYEPTKIILRKAFDYPNCFIDLSGKYISDITKFVVR